MLTATTTNKGQAPFEDTEDDDPLSGSDQTLKKYRSVLFCSEYLFAL